MKQYNVALKEGIDYDEFWNDMESDTDGGKLYIPNRAVEFTNERPASLRQCWYLLTDEEAELLRQDDRVFCVEIPPEFRTDIVMMPRVTQTGDFTKTTSDSGAVTIILFFVKLIPVRFKELKIRSVYFT